MGEEGGGGAGGAERTAAGVEDEVMGCGALGNLWEWVHGVQDAMMASACHLWTRVLTVW
jgi:hypothetical protein